ncbi:MAG: hypothetical protein ACI92I_000058 [Acidimicrobiales bacterium]|jgi:hypothetical protein
MFRTEKSVGMLKTIAMIAGFAILLWSLGLPSLRFVDAANVSSFSDTITDSSPSAAPTHTFSFVTPTGVANGETITFTFPSGFTGIGSIVDGDVTIDDDSSDISANVSAAGAGQIVTLTVATGSIAAASVVDVVVGVTNFVTSPGSEGSYEILLGGSMTDTGSTRIVILTAVTVTATVDTIFTFTVSGTAANTELSSGGATTTGAAASTSVTFGKLDALVATSSAHELSVSTNASNGYVVTVQVDGALESSTGADIDGINDADVPGNWVSPTSPTLGVDSTYGWWGISSDDTTITSRGTQFVAGQFIGATTTPRAVMGNDGPASGTGVGVGTTTIGFKTEISALQEAGDDYSAVLTYIATPTF